MLRSSNWDIKAAVTALLLSDEFRSGDPRLYRQSVRQPIELAVAACRAFNVPADDVAILDACRRMGQAPFGPPNVGGWPVGAAWISPATMLAHYDLALAVLAEWQNQSEAARKVLPASFDTGGWATTLGIDALSPTTLNVLNSYLSSRATAPEADKQAGVLALLFVSPEWVVI